MPEQARARGTRGAGVSAIAPPPAGRRGPGGVGGVVAIAGWLPVIIGWRRGWRHGKAPLFQRGGCAASASLGRSLPARDDLSSLRELSRGAAPPVESRERLIRLGRAVSGSGDSK